MSRVTLQTVADEVGVSRMTVSNAFSRPAQLSAELRERILAVAEDLGYGGPDPAGRALAKGSTGTIGILFSSSLQTLFAEEVSTAFLGAIADGLADSGLSLTLLTTGEVAGRLPVRDVPMDATLVFTSQYDEPAMGWLRKRALPVVLVDQEPLPGVASVNVDDRDGARQGAQHLLDLGHRRIGIVTVGLSGPYGWQPDLSVDSSAVESYIIGQRTRGWLDALTAAGVTPVLVRQPKTPYQPEADGYAALSLLLAADPGITAVLCFSDRFAHGIMVAAQDRGLSVPGDLSVVGFDDSPLASNLRPTLTTVHQGLTEKGHAAAAALIAAVRSKSTPLAAPPDESLSPSGHVVLPVTLVARDSTAPPINPTAPTAVGGN